MTTSEAPPLVYLVAGEPSGDLLGARLMAALKLEASTELRFAGIGGPEMQREGLKSLFPMSDLAVMGLAEVLPRLPLLLRRIRETAGDVLRNNPSVLVTIDSPDFSFRVAKKVHGKGVPVVHYVAPTVWAWRAGRARKISEFLDHLLTLLPFEPPYFEQEGLASTFVGHPVVEGPAMNADGAGFRDRHHIAPAIPVLTVLPGSRRGEVERHLPVFRETVDKLIHDRPDMKVIGIAAPNVAEIVTDAFRDWSTPVLVVDDPQDKYAAMAAGNVALAASGTVALELAATGTPSVIAYRVSAVSAWLARRLIKVRFANLINLTLNREAVPECLQEQCRADILSSRLKGLLDDPAKAGRQRVDCREALKALHGGGEGGPARQAARIVLEQLRA